MDGQETQLQVPDNYTAGRLVQVLHRQIPMKPGAKMALLWKHRKIFMDERLSDLGMEDCEELTYIFEATAVRQACEAFAGLVHGENRIYALEGLTKLHIGRNLQGGLQNIHLPDSLQALTFGAFFDQSLQGVTLPSRLRILAFSSVFSRRLDPAPSLRSISLDEDFNHPLQQVTLPEGLQTLSFGRSFNQSLRGLKLPASLLNLVLSANFNQSLQGVDFPEHLQNLVLGYHFNQSLEEVKLPRGLASLQFGKSFNQSLERVSFPKNLQSLTLGQDFEQSLKPLCDLHLEVLSFSGKLFAERAEQPPLGFLARLRQLWQAPPIRCESLSFSHLQVLNLGPDFEQPLGHWELQHLRELHTGRSSELPKLHPESLQVLSFRGEQKDTLDLQSFQHLRSLTWGSSPLECSLPHQLECLTFGEDFDHSLEGVHFPDGWREEKSLKSCLGRVLVAGSCLPLFCSLPGFLLFWGWGNRRLSVCSPKTEKTPPVWGRQGAEKTPERVKSMSLKVVTRTLCMEAIASRLEAIAGARS
ncbi:Putative F-box and FNIP repeat-containing protein L60 [Durusdinium trenchii]|uniref:F-box and FNIP repeat-containing protein L60 n=1 Tax=Durusdinium trenchii TaxID=1381693 RepID=A0ABP0L6D4_9DINO